MDNWLTGSVSLAHGKWAVPKQSENIAGQYGDAGLLIFCE